MSDDISITCPSCGEQNRVSARFCSNCAYRFPRPSPVAVAAVQHGVTAEGAHESDHGESHTEHKDVFYLWIFLALAVVTIIEVFATVIDNTAGRTFVLVISAVAKFALVAMFFMHLKGDQKLFSNVFVLPLLLAISVVVSLFAIFGKF